MRNTPGKNVLIIGKVPAMGKKLRANLNERGITARTTTATERALQEFDGADFDLIAFGGGVEAPLRRKLKEGFSKRNSKAILLDVFAPVAVEQIDRALRGESKKHEFASRFVIGDDGDEIPVRLELLQPCRVRVEVYHLGEKLRGRIIVDHEAPSGSFEVRLGKSRLRQGPNMILAVVGEREFFFERIEVPAFPAGDPSIQK